MAKTDQFLKKIDWVRQHGSEYTAKEVADKLGIAQSTAYSYAKIAGIELLHKEGSGGRPRKAIGKTTKEPCKLRPYGCFRCPNPDCICDLAINDKESEYSDLGHLLDGEKAERARESSREHFRRVRNNTANKHRKRNKDESTYKKTDDGK